MSNEDLLAQLERVLLIYERSQELELKKAEMKAKIAADILAENRKATFELMTYFSQFLGSTIPLKLDDNKD